MIEDDRSFDWHPRSPDYVEPLTDEEAEALERYKEDGAEARWHELNEMMEYL